MPPAVGANAPDLATYGAVPEIVPLVSVWNVASVGRQAVGTVNGPQTPNATLPVGAGWVPTAPPTVIVATSRTSVPPTTLVAVVLLVLSFGVVERPHVQVLKLPRARSFRVDVITLDEREWAANEFRQPANG